MLWVFRMLFGKQQLGKSFLDNMLFGKILNMHTFTIIVLGAVHKRRHQFFDILTPLPPSSSILLNKLIN